MLCPPDHLGLRAQTWVPKGPSRPLRCPFLERAFHQGKPWMQRAKYSGWPPAAITSLWSPGGTNVLVQPTSSPESLSDPCLSKFCVRKCTLSDPESPLSCTEIHTRLSTNSGRKHTSLPGCTVWCKKRTFALPKYMKGQLS